ncbi:hypothetical protein ANRL1_04746 [Anaerolineae bacterium]|nr:hypothetical protein ANRL1_04746 [Anaerolineae bacterium]
MELNKYPAPHNQVATRIVDGSAVIVLADSGEVMVLNAVGTRIWQLTDGIRTVQEIIESIQREYAVAPEQAHNDVAELLQKLMDSNALVLREQPIPSPIK